MLSKYKRQICALFIVILCFCLSANSLADPDIPNNVKNEYKYGTTDNSIITVKERLQELGYYSPTAVFSASIGASLKEAVKEFQKANGIKETGKLNSELFNVLFSSSAIRNPSADWGIDYKDKIEFGKWTVFYYFDKETYKSNSKVIIHYEIKKVRDYFPYKKIVCRCIVANNYSANTIETKELADSVGVIEYILSPVGLTDSMPVNVTETYVDFEIIEADGTSISALTKKVPINNISKQSEKIYPLGIQHNDNTPQTATKESDTPDGSKEDRTLSALLYCSVGVVAFVLIRSAKARITKRITYKDNGNSFQKRKIRKEIQKLKEEQVRIANEKNALRDKEMKIQNTFENNKNDRNELEKEKRAVAAMKSDILAQNDHLRARERQISDREERIIEVAEKLKKETEEIRKFDSERTEIQKEKECITKKSEELSRQEEELKAEKKRIEKLRSELYEHDKQIKKKEQNLKGEEERLIQFSASLTRQADEQKKTASAQRHKWIELEEEKKQNEAYYEKLKKMEHDLHNEETSSLNDRIIRIKKEEERLSQLSASLTRQADEQKKTASAQRHKWIELEEEKQQNKAYYEKLKKMEFDLHSKEAFAKEEAKKEQLRLSEKARELEQKEVQLTSQAIEYKQEQMELSMPKIDETTQQDVSDANIKNQHSIAFMETEESEESINLAIQSKVNVITNSFFSIVINQIKPCSVKCPSRNFILRFQSMNNGTIVSDEKEIVTTNSDGNDMTSKLTFQLISGTYNKDDDYCLVIIDKSLNKIVKSYPYKIDIAFSLDFGF